MKQLFLTIAFLCISLIVSQSFAQCTKPNPPVITNAETCVGEPNNALTAQGQNITWYQDQEKTIVLQTNSNSYTPTVTNDNTYTYYATQTVNSCESDVAPAIYTIKPIPTAPIVIVIPNSICQYQTYPNFTATPSVGGTIKWYEPDEFTFIKTGTSLTPDRPVSSYTIKYYASQVVNGCEGPKSSATLTIKPNPSNPIPSDKTVCEGQTTNLPALSAQNATLNDKWYNDAAATSWLSNGYSYQVHASEFGSFDRNFYVVRSIQGCNSDTIAVKLTVIPKPTISIEENISTCFSKDAIDATVTPAYNETTSSIEWTLFNNSTVVSHKNQKDFYPYTAITSPGTYSLQALYSITSQDITCTSNPITTQLTVLPCFTREYLLYLIDSANYLIQNAQELKTYKTYTKGAKAALQSKIDAAQLVYNSLSSTSDQINTAAENLKQAIAEFHSEEVAIDYIESHDVTVSPNPAITTISIQGIPVDEIRSVMLYNQFGVLVLQSHTHRLDIAHLPRGVYTCVVKTDVKQYSQKIILLPEKENR